MNEKQLICLAEIAKKNHRAAEQIILCREELKALRQDNNDLLNFNLRNLAIDDIYIPVIQERLKFAFEAIIDDLTKQLEAQTPMSIAIALEEAGKEQEVNHAAI